MPTMHHLRRIIAKTPVRKTVVWFRHRNLAEWDAFVGSYPRSGSTWLRFLLTEVLSGTPATFENVNKIIPQVGEHHQAPRLLPKNGRLIKTHEAYRPEYYRGIYLVRDPRDVVLSEYAYQQALGLVSDDLDAYLNLFLDGRVNGYGSWQDHAQSWIEAASRNPKMLMVVKFENLRKDTPATLALILDFLNASASAEVIQSAITNNSVDRMRAKEKQTPQKASERGRFIRSGSVGGWRERMTAEQLSRVNVYANRELSILGYSAGV